MHIKRKAIPKTWPISKKNHPYIHVPKSSNKKEFSVSLIIVIRDMLKKSQNFKETKKIIRAGEIKINGKIIKNEKQGLGLFDILQIEKMGKSYILLLTEGGDLYLKETKDDKNKIAKVIGKKVQNKKIIQLNLMGGINLITKEKINVNDSVLLDFEKKQIIKVLPLKKEAQVFITAGKWVGKIGKIEDIRGKKVDLAINNNRISDIPLKNLIVINKEIQ